MLEESVNAAYRALAVIVAQYEAGLQGVDFNRYAVILQSLVSQQDQWAVSQGQIGQGLIQVYRALGGGWQIRLAPDANWLRDLPPVIEPPGFNVEEVPPADMIAPPVPPVLVEPEELPPVDAPAPQDRPQPEPPGPAPVEELPMARGGPSSRRVSRRG